MKKSRYYTLMGIGLLSLSLALSAYKPADKKNKQAIEMIYTNVEATGTGLDFKFEAGESHNHPTMAIWLETLDGEYIQMLYVTESLASGVYGHGQSADGMWKREEGEARRPATLPYFLHKRGVKAPDGTYLPTPDNPIIDAYTAATPKHNFSLGSKADELLKGKVRVMVELNQPWDWNEYWNNTKYPDDVDYSTSCQPSLIYLAIIDFEKPMDYYGLNPVGHGHYSGKDGELYTDISTLTTAKHIFDKIELRIMP